MTPEELSSLYKNTTDETVRRLIELAHDHDMSAKDAERRATELQDAFLRTHDKLRKAEAERDYLLSVEAADAMLREWRERAEKAEAEVRELAATALTREAEYEENYQRAVEAEAELFRMRRRSEEHWERAKERETTLARVRELCDYPDGHAWPNEPFVYVDRLRSALDERTDQ